MIRRRIIIIGGIMILEIMMVIDIIINEIIIGDIRAIILIAATKEATIGTQITNKADIKNMIETVADMIDRVETDLAADIIIIDPVAIITIEKAAAPEAEPASNAKKKDTWPETVQTQTPATVEDLQEEKVVVFHPDQLNVITAKEKGIWHVIALSLKRKENREVTVMAVIVIAEIIIIIAEEIETTEAVVIGTEITTLVVVAAAAAVAGKMMTALPAGKMTVPPTGMKNHPKQRIKLRKTVTAKTPGQPKKHHQPKRTHQNVTKSQ